MKLAQSNVQRVEHLAATPIATTTQNQSSKTHLVHRPPTDGSEAASGGAEQWRWRYGQDLQGHASFKASNARYVKL